MLLSCTIIENFIKVIVEGMRDLSIKKILKDINFEEFIGTDYENDFPLKTIKKKEFPPL